MCVACIVFVWYFYDSVCILEVISKVPVSSAGFLRLPPIMDFSGFFFFFLKFFGGIEWKSRIQNPECHPSTTHRMGVAFLYGRANELIPRKRNYDVSRGDPTWHRETNPNSLSLLSIRPF